MLLLVHLLLLLLLHLLLLLLHRVLLLLHGVGEGRVTGNASVHATKVRHASSTSKETSLKSSEIGRTLLTGRKRRRRRTLSSDGSPGVRLSLSELSRIHTPLLTGLLRLTVRETSHLTGETVGRRESGPAGHGSRLTRERHGKGAAVRVETLTGLLLREGELVLDWRELRAEVRLRKDARKLRVGREQRETVLLTRRNTDQYKKKR